METAAPSLANVTGPPAPLRRVGQAFPVLLSGQRGSDFSLPTRGAVVVLASPSRVLLDPEAVQVVQRIFDLDVDDVLTRLAFKASVGQLSSVVPHQRPASVIPAGEASVEHLPALTLVVVGVGQPEPGPQGWVALRRSAALAARSCAGHAQVSLLWPEADGTCWDAAALQAFATGWMLGAYTPAREHSPKAQAAREQDQDQPQEHVQPGQAQTVQLLTGANGPALEQVAATVQQASYAALATWIARDWANAHAGVKSAQWLAQRATELAQASGLDVRVWDQAQLAEQGFGGLLAVGSASQRPPRLIQLRYTPAGTAADADPIVLVGKGITFDSGGLSLKPREMMPTMKTDMSGAAAVMAALVAASVAQLPVPVVGLLACADNVISGSSYRPDDVVRMFDGTTVQIANTDAEGRLVLADALSYACARLHPCVVVDVATLTGAASLGLGKSHAALFSPDAQLVSQLVQAGRDSGELVWQMPLVQGYRASLRSEIADVCHISTDASVSAGAITAALFLQRFVGQTRWAHLDIAGPARADADDGEITKGGTGFAARLLVQWLRDQAGSLLSVRASNTP